MATRRIKIAGLGWFRIDDTKTKAIVSEGDLVLSDDTAGDNTLAYLASGGAAAGAIKGDGTTDLYFRMSRLTVSKGTSFGIKVVLESKWNGDSFTMDNMAAGYDSGGFRFDSNLYQMYISSPIVGTVVGAIAHVAGNLTGSVLISDATIDTAGILLTLTREDGSNPDISTVIIPGSFYIDILYITSGTA